jgi:hypothetical protein
MLKNYTDITYFICWVLFYIPQVATPETFIYNAFGDVFYMPTLLWQFYLNALKLNNR